MFHRVVRFDENGRIDYESPGFVVVRLGAVCLIAVSPLILVGVILS